MAAKRTMPTVVVTTDKKQYLTGPRSALSTRISTGTRPSPSARWRIGEQIAYQSDARKFQIESILSGGMGIVYVVTDTDSGEPFVVKTIQQHMARHASILARFQREAEAWIALEKHPHIVQARGFEYLAGEPHIYLEYVSGGSLRDLMRRAQLPVQQALRLAVEICRGMHHAAQMGITAHRDLKPDNILITANRSAKVTDFGLVKMLDETGPEAAAGATAQIEASLLISETGALAPAPLTRVDIGFGTKEYMPPEQWLNAAGTDVRSDIYALGVMLFEMLTGVRPFFGKTPDKLRDKHFSFHPPPPSSLRQGDLPESIDQLTLRCLQKRPQDRFDDFAALEGALTRLLHHEFRQIVSLLSEEQMTVGEINERGTAFFHLRKLPAALNCFQDALQQSPQNAIAWANQAVTLAEMARFDEALESFERALSLDADNPVVLTNKGMTLTELGREKEALACYARATDLDSFLQPAWRYQCEALNRLGRHEEAYYAALRARQLEPQDTSAYYQEALALVKLGVANRALMVIEGLERQVGWLSPAATLLKAQIAHAQGRFKDACQLCAAVPKDAPEYAQAVAFGLECALLLPDLDEVAVLLNDITTPEQGKLVLPHFRTALQKIVARPKQALRLLALACEAAVKAGDLVIARSWYEIWEKRSQVEDEPHKPRFGLKTILAQQPVDGPNCIAQGRLLLQLGETQKAIPLLGSGLEMTPKDAEGWQALATACNKARNYKDAATAFERLTRLKSDDAEIWRAFAEAALRANRSTLALDAAQKAQRLAPNDPLVLFLHGAALFADEKYGQAIRQFDRALALDENLAVAIWNKGLCTRRMGRTIIANRCMHKARSLDVRFWRSSSYAEKPLLPVPLVFTTYAESGHA